MVVNIVGSKVIIPTIIIFNSFISFHWWNYEVVLYYFKTKREHQPISQQRKELIEVLTTLSYGVVVFVTIIVMLSFFV